MHARLTGRIALLILAGSLGAPAAASADVQVFVNRYLDWLVATQTQVRTIDFETLPNGAPSQVGVPITATFNYTAQGVTFDAHMPTTFFGIAGNQVNGFDLRTFMLDPPFRTWIIADLVVPTNAVGVFFPGGTVFSAFDANGELLASQLFGAPGGGHFIGFVSDVPIARTTIDEGSGIETIDSFVFNPIPEPATGAVALAVLCLLVRRRR